MPSLTRALIAVNVAVFLLQQLLGSPLTDKEERILDLLSQGKSNKQIANTVFLAEGTVKNYVSRIMEKLHSRSRTELAVRAIGRRG